MTTTQDAANIAQTMRDTVEQLSHAETAPEFTGYHFHDPHIITVPKGREVRDLTREIRAAAEYLKPARRAGTARLTTIASLITWATRFKSEDSALFAVTALPQPSLTCIADYHAAGPATIDAQAGDPAARHMHHRGVYAFPVSPEWEIWNGAPEGMTKGEFGTFLEDNIADMLDPSPFLLTGKGAPEPWEIDNAEIAAKLGGRFGQVARLLEISRTLQIHESSNLTMTTNRDTGEGAIQFINEHKDADGRPLTIPTLFLIGIPIFTGDCSYRLPVRLRYRKSGADVRFTVSIFDAARAYDKAVTEAINYASGATGLPIFEGTPEA